MVSISEKLNLKPQLSGADIKSLYEAEADTNAYTDAEKTFVSTALQPTETETVSGDYTFNGALYLPNNSRINNIEHFYQTTKPTTRGDSSALVAGDRWWKTDDGTEWFWNGTYWLSNLKGTMIQPIQAVTTTTGGFPFLIEGGTTNVLISYYKVYFYLNPYTSPPSLSDTDYHVLRLYSGGSLLYDLAIKAADNGARNEFITKTSPIIDIVANKNNLTCSFRYDAGNGTPKAIEIQPIPIKLFYHTIYD